MARINEKPAATLGLILVRSLLSIIFILVAIIIIIPFLAGVQFDAAQRLEKKYLWQDAQNKFEIATRIDPFDASILAGFGEFLKNISPNRLDENSLLVNSAKLYKRALDLDPFNAEYALRLAELKIALFIRIQPKKNTLLTEALDYARQALESDPKGFNVSYGVGYAGISVWDKLNAPEKELVLGRLKYILKARPWYSEYIYTQLMQTTKDAELFRKIRPTETDIEKRKKLARIEKLKNEYKNKFEPVGTDGNLLLPQEWQGKSKSGDDVYENGNMYWTGTIDAGLNVPEGKSTVKIQAKGSPANNIWPYMIVELDGREIGGTFVDSAEWKEYSFPIETSAGLEVLSVTFLNDGGNAQKDEDRNLYVGEAKIIKNE